MGSHNAVCSDEECIRVLESAPTVRAAAEKLGIHERTLLARRRRLERIYGITIRKLDDPRCNWPTWEHENYRHDKPFDILIGSDRHALPGERPQVVKLFLEIAAELRPRLLIINGDWFDFPQLSRHNRLGWEKEAKPADELRDGAELLDDIAKVTPKSHRYFIRGNHDNRLDGKLSNVCPELEGVFGSRLSDHISKQYTMAWSLDVNDCLMVKHRYRGGETAVKNNVQKSGVNIATGHDHTLKVWPYTDYRGTRYGMTTGTLSDPWAIPFMYAENNPRDWQPGFLVIHVEPDSKADDVITPEPVYMVSDKHHRRWGSARFRGKWYG